MNKVVKMIDGMVATLQQQQVDEDKKHKFCAKEFDSAEDKRKGLARTASDLDATIGKGQDALSALEEEIQALEDGIKALDASVAEATEQRKEENKDFTELMAQDSAAKELILFAKNRMQKFYNPKLYKPPPKRELSEEDRVTV